MSMSDLLCGFGAAATTLGVTAYTTGDIVTSIVLSVVSALIFAIINIITKVVTSILEKKGIISAEHKKVIDDTADDLADDGKINGSNRLKESKVDQKESDDVK